MLQVSTDNQKCECCAKDSGDAGANKEGWIILLGCLVQIGEPNKIGHDMRMIGEKNPTFFCSLECVKHYFPTRSILPVQKNALA